METTLNPCFICSCTTYPEKRAVLWCGGERTVVGSYVEKYLEVKLSNYTENGKCMYCCIACKRKLVTIHGKGEELRRLFYVAKENNPPREKRPREPVETSSSLPAKKKTQVNILYKFVDSSYLI